LRKFLRLTLAAAVVVFTAALLGGPVRSGGVFLLLPAPHRAAEHGLPEDYEPRHKGSVTLSSGTYVRDNEDLIVGGTPALILRRSYLSGYRAPKEFGIGTTHAGEDYLVGDETFQQATLVQANGTLIEFARTSSGTSWVNAMYKHSSSPSEWQGARLGWAVIGWALRRTDGSLSIFQACDDDRGRSCSSSIVKSRDADGHSIHYRRDQAGHLLKMEAGPDRSIGFDYDAKDRIVRAYSSDKREVHYQYDDRGRLTTVTSSDGPIRRYTYTALDELATISEPGTSIENIYESGRVVRQINRFEDGAQPYTFDFTYQVTAGVLVRTTSRQSDGSWKEYTWSRDRYSTSETWGRDGVQPAVFTYDRDPASNIITALTLTCPDRTGRPLRHSSLVRPGRQDWIKQDLLSTHCSWSDRRSRGE
jgi:YD repeat-containing protein